MTAKPRATVRLAAMVATRTPPPRYPPVTELRRASEPMAAIS